MNLNPALRAVTAPVASAYRGGQRMLAGGFTQVRNLAFTAGGYMAEQEIEKRIAPWTENYGAIATKAVALGATYGVARLAVPNDANSVAFGAALAIIVDLIR